MMKVYEWMHIKFPNYVDCRPIDAERALRYVGLAVLDAEQMSMRGLPVDVILAGET